MPEWIGMGGNHSGAHLKQTIILGLQEFCSKQTTARKPIFVRPTTTMVVVVVVVSRIKLARAHCK